MYFISHIGNLVIVLIAIAIIDWIISRIQFFVVLFCESFGLVPLKKFNVALHICLALLQHYYPVPEISQKKDNECKESFSRPIHEIGDAPSIPDRLDEKVRRGIHSTL